jgi:hypothetical protein
MAFLQNFLFCLFPHLFWHHIVVSVAGKNFMQGELVAMQKFQLGYIFHPMIYRDVPFLL